MENNIIVIKKCYYCSSKQCPWASKYYPDKTCKNIRIYLNTIKGKDCYAESERGLRRGLIPML